MNSRSSTAPQRTLSLTEELEKLEQSITLTLQEIDHNFSKAHRIVTTDILPIIDQYAEHSQAVWEGSKFWKQFFEASANVSLSGYAEPALDEEQDATLSQSQQDDGNDSRAEEDILANRQDNYEQGEDSMLDDGDVSGSTPRPPQMRSAVGGRPSFAEFESPYEDLKRELKGSTEPAFDYDVTGFDPETPGPQRALPDMSMTPMSSPFEPTTRFPVSQQSSRKAADPLLHRVLDKNYRVQATPHTARKAPQAMTSWRDASSPMSSPPIMAPQLRSEIFSSPARKQFNKIAAPRTPGVSVQTPKKGKGRDVWADDEEVDWGSDDDVHDVYKELGMSPPKTIQFAVGQSKLLQTPAREASKRIVEDLLLTAGVGQDSDLDNSPSVIRPSSNMDDSF